MELLALATTQPSDHTTVIVGGRGNLHISLSNYLQAKHSVRSSFIFSGGIGVVIAAPEDKVWKWSQEYVREYGGKASKDADGSIWMRSNSTRSDQNFSPALTPNKLRAKLKTDYPAWNAVSYAIKTGTLYNKDSIKSLNYVYAPFCKENGTKGQYFSGSVELIREGKTRNIGL